MAKEKIVEAAVELSVTGLGQVKSQLKEVEKAAEKVGKKSASGGGASGGGGGGGGMLSGLLGGAASAGPALAALGAVGAVLAVAAAAAAAAAAGLATVVSLLKTADPGRFAQFTTKLEVAQIILGRNFIPLLQLAVSVIDRINGVLRKFDGGGLSKFVKSITAALERAANAVFPAFVAVLEIIDKLFDDLSGTVDEFGGILGEMVETFLNAENIKTILQPMAEYFAVLIKHAVKLAAILWDVFGPVIQMQLKAVANIIGFLYTVLTRLITIVTTLADVMKSAFQTAVKAMIQGINMMIAGINIMIERLNMAIGAFNKISPKRLQLAKIPTLGPIAEPTFGGDKRKLKPGEKDGMTNNPLLTVKPEFTALEEMFRKAQTSVTTDPAKEAERERRRQADVQIGLQQQIANNTAGKPGAYRAA